MLDELLSEYVELFNESFPIFVAHGMTEEEMIDILKKCIKEKLPYQIPDWIKKDYYSNEFDF